MTSSSIATGTAITQWHRVGSEVLCSNHPAIMPDVFVVLLCLSREMVGYNFDYLGQERFLPNYF
jgi:hypothetical protein